MNFERNHMASTRQRHAVAANPSTPRVITRCGQRMSFSVDPETRAKLAWGSSVLRALLDVPVNFSTILRVAIGLYVDHLDELLEQIRQARLQGLTPSVTD